MEDEYLSHEARVLYVMCIRRYMDYRTGLTGTVRKVSYQMFQERLEVQRRRGSKLSPLIPTKKQLRGYVDELVSIGLIEKLPQQKRTDPMVFRCLLANTDSVRFDEEGHMKGIRRGHEEGHTQTQRIRGIQGSDGHNEGHMKDKEEGHTSVTSDISTTPTTAREDDKFAMHPTWKPSASLSDRLQLAGIKLEDLDPDQRKLIFGEFVSYWLGQPGRTCRQSEWEHKLIQAVLKHVADKNRSPPDQPTRSVVNLDTSRQQTRQEVTASVMDIQDTNW